MELLLDTNFIITSITNKIQLFDDVCEIFPNHVIIVPKQVIIELRSIRDKKNKVKFKDSAKLALQLIENCPLKIINLGKKDVDVGIIKYSKGKDQLVVGTLDRDLKNKIKSVNEKVRFLTIKEKKRIAIQ